MLSDGSSITHLILHINQLLIDSHVSVKRITFETMCIEESIFFIYTQNTTCLLITCFKHDKGYH